MSASNRGGVIFIADSVTSDVNIVNSSFIDVAAKSTAGNGGGGIIFISNHLYGVLQILNSNFTNIYTYSSGGIVCINGWGNVIIFKDSNFTNITSWDGGVIFVNDVNNVTFINSSFKEVSIKNYGGILAAYKSCVYFGSFNSTFEDVTTLNSPGYGGVAYLASGNMGIEFIDSHVTNVTVITYGGVIFSGGSGTANIFNSSFIDIDASAASLIYFPSGTSKINDNIIVPKSLTKPTMGASGNLNSNWWGLNQPDFNTLIGTSTKPETWVVMGFTNTTPIQSGSTPTTLLVSLDTIYNKTSNNFTSLNYNLSKERTVIYNTSIPSASFSDNNIDFKGNITNTITYSSIPTNWFITANIDYQTLPLGPGSLYINISASKNPVHLYEIINYTITVSTIANFNNISIFFNNSFIYLNSSGYGVYNSSTKMWHIDNVNSSSPRTITITMRVPYNQSLVNTTVSTRVNTTGIVDLNYANPVTCEDEVNVTVLNITGGSYTLLQALIDSTPDGGILNLYLNITYNPEYDFALINGMYLNKTIILNGNGYTISGNNTARIFQVSGLNVIIANATLTDGYWGSTTTYNGGAAIYLYNFNTKLTIDNCNITNNFVRGWGGAIYSRGFDDIIIRNSYFGNNTVTYGTWTIGGAIGLYSGGVTGNRFIIFNSTFDSNGVEAPSGPGQEGAAIYSSRINFINITNSIFTNNSCRDTTTSYAGALCLYGSSNTFINYNVFVDNNAMYGSAIHGDGVGNFNYNWFGTNNPNWGSLFNGFSYPETWVVMNFTNTTPINYSSGTSDLLVSLDTVYNSTSMGYQPLVGDLPARTVTFNWTHGNVTPNITNISGNVNADFDYLAYPNMYNWIINATIDNQMLWLGGADIGISITPSSNPIDDGFNITFNVTVVNNEPMNSTDINATIYLPLSGLNILNITPSGGVYNNTTGIWEIGNLTAGQNVTLEINATLADSGPNLVWNATVNYGNQYDYNHTNNTVISNITVNQIADLEIHKNLTTNVTPQAKDNITYMIVVYNNGPSTAVNVTVFDNLSSKLIYLNSSATKGFYNETTGIWEIDNITPYSNETLNITVCLNKSGFINNYVNVTSNITDNNLTNNFDNISFTTPPLSDLWVTITMEPQSSNYITYHIQAGNNGIEDANGTVVVFNLSNLYIYFNHTEDKGLYNNLTGVWDIGELNVNETVNMTLIVRLDFPTGTTFANITTAVNITSWSTDLYPNNNTDNVTFEAEIFGNFRLLQDIVDSWPENTTQILPRSFAYDPVSDAKWPSETYDLINGVRLYKNVTIVNPYGFTLGGFDMARIFNISADNVVLDGLRFFDGNSPLGAGLNIHADNVQVLRSNFTGNWLYGDYGGAIFTSGKYTLIMDNIFTENAATKLGGGIGAVGATNLQILNNTFINNTVESDEVFGGAVGIANSTAIVNNNVFLDNWATNAPNLGSAIYTYNSNVNLNDNWFGNNTPDMLTDDLIWGVKPETYIILDWEIVNPNMAGVELNVVFLSYNRTSGTRTPLSEGLPYRNLTVVARDPTLSWYNKTYTGNNSVNYTYNTAIPVYLVNATVDYQTITLEWSTFLDINKTLVNDTIWFGDDLIYNITLVNYGPHDSYIVTVSDFLPENLTINSVNATYGSTSIIGDNAYWTISINAGSTLNFIVNTTPVSEGVFVNNVTVNSTGVYDYFWHGNSTNASGEVMPLADLSVNITISNPPYYVGEEINYTIIIHNSGPSNATNVSVYIPISGGLTFLYAWNLDGYIPNYTVSTGLWNVGVLHVNETIEINMTLRLDSAGWYNQTVNITGHVIDINNTNDNDTVSFNVSTQVDLELNMTINKNVTLAGDTNVQITYSLINKGPSLATNVSVFTVFSGLQYLGASGYGSFNNLTPFTGYWIVGNLSKNQLVTITLTFNASSLGSFTVTGRANCSDNESYWPDNYDNVTLDVTEYADLSITKTVSNSTPFLLHNVTYTITVRNNGPYNTYNVTVYDLLPTVLVYDNLTVGFNGTEWFVGNLTPGESKNISFNVTVDGIGDIWNNVTVNSSTLDSDYSNNHDEVVIHVPVADDLRIYLNVLPSTPSSNTMFLINVSVWNYGYEDNNDVYVEFHIPSGLSWVSDTSSGAYNHLTGIWNIGALGNGQWTNMEIWVTPSVMGNVTLQANVTGQVADPAPWNNRANLTFEIVPSFDLTITKTANATSIIDGDYVTFYIAVSNKGPYTAKDVSVIDSLPNGVIYLINNMSGVYDNNTYTVNWTISNLGVGETRLIELRVRSWGPGTSFTNFVNVSAYGVDSNITDNTASVTVNVSQVVDLEVILNASKVVDIDLGENITFYVTVVNHGPSNATGVIANFIVPSLFTLIGENSTGTYNNVTGDWLIGNLGSGENITLELNATLTTTGKCIANATVNGTYPDTNTTNNYDELNITATRLSDLNITAYWSNNSIFWYDLSNLTIIVSNAGPDDAVNVTVIINVPGLTFVNSTGDYNDTLMVWNVGNLSVGQYKNITITFNGTICGLWNTTGNISANGIDNDTSNNNFTINITVLPVVDLIMTNLTVNTTFTGLDNILEFNVTVYNAGPCNATNTTILGLLPVNWTIYGGSISADIPVNTSHTFNILVNASSCGNFTVGFNATIDGLDTNISNNWMYIGPIEVIYSADLMITIKTSNNMPVAGDIVVYVVTVSNLDWRTAHNVTANVTIPSNLTFDHYYLASGSYNSFNGNWNIGDLSFRNSTSLFLFVRVNNPGNTSFWVNVSGDDYDFNLENNNDTCIIDAGNGLDLNITIAADNYTPYVGDNVIFTVVVENSTSIDATGVSVDFNIPVGWVNITCLDLNFTGASWYIGKLTGGSSKILTFTATPVILGNLTVNATVNSNEFDYNLTNNFANLTVSPIGVSDLEVNITCNNMAPMLDEIVTYTISVLNKGLVSVDTVLVYNNLPYSTVYSTSVLSYNPGLKLWTIFNLTPNKIETLNITINHTTTGIFNYTANITGNILELNTSNNLDNITVTVSDYNDLITYFTVSNNSVVDNGFLNFTITVYNNGTFNYTNVIVYTNLPETTLYNGSGIFDTNIGLWDIGNLTSGENKTLTLTINMTNVGNYTYWANATSKEQDKNLTNNNQSLNVTIYADYDVKVNITLNNNTTLNIGDNISFTINVSNDGPSTAYNVCVLNDIPGTIIDSISKGSYVANNWTIGTLDSGETATLTVNLTLTSNGTFTYNVEAILDDLLFDRNLTNNKDNITITVLNGVDLIITIESNSTLVNKSDTVEIIVTVHNNGTNTANNILIDTSGLFEDVISIINSTGFVSGSQWFIPTITTYGNETLKITRTIINDTLIIVNVSSDNVELNNESNSANLTINLTKFTDLQVTITANDTNLIMEDNLTFTITVYNKGNDTAENVTVYLDLPYSTKYSDVYMYDSLQGIWNVGTIPNGTNRTLNVTVTLNTFGIIIFNATVNTTTTDINLTNNVDNVTLNISNLVDLSINVTVNSNNLFVGDNVTFTITVTNYGPGNATSVSANVNLPGSISYINKGVYTSGVWNIGDLNKDETVTLKLKQTLTLTDQGVYLLNLSSTDLDSNLTNNNFTFNLTLNLSSDLEIQIKSSTNIINVTNPLNYTVIVFNHGINNVTGANVTFTLPNGFIISSNMTTNGIFTSNIWTLGTLNAGNNATLYIYGSYNTSGNKTLNVLVNSTNYDSNRTNNYANTTVFITQQADLYLNFTTTDYYNPDGTITFNITVTNHGPSTAENITIYTNLDSTSNYNTTIDYFDTLQNIWYINTMVVGETQTLIINTTAIGNIEYYANVTSSTEELNKSNNVKYLNLTVTPLADLSINITANTTLLHIGDSVNFTVTVTNLDPYNATGVNVYTSLPASPDYTVTKGLYDTINGNWNIGNLSIGETTTLNLILNITNTGTYTYIVNVTSSSNDTNISNNNDTINLTVDETADLGIKILTNTSSFIVGENITFTLNVTNYGLNNATNITTYFTLENFTITSINTITGTFDNVTWNITGFTNDTSLELNITGFFTTNGTKDIRVNVTSLIYDNDTSNNYDTLTYSVINPFDLEIILTANATNIYAGEFVEFIVNITNHGPGIAENILIKTNILNATSIKPNGYYDKDTGYIFINSLDANSTILINLTKQITLNTTFTVNITNSDLNNTNNNGTIFINVGDCADLNITVTVNTLNPYFDDDLTYTITVANIGYSLAGNLNVNTTLLFTGFNFINANSTNYANGLWAIGNLNGGESAILTVNFKTNKSGLVNATFNATTSTYESNTFNNYANLTINVSNSYKPTDDLVDLIINITVNNTNPNINETVLFNITVFNNASTDATNLTILSFLPSGLTPLGAYTGNWTVTNLTAYTNISFTFVANITSYGSFVTNTSVDCSELDQNAINNRANVLVVSSAPSTNYVDLILNVTKDGNLTLGETFTYNITVTNKGSSTATDVNCTISLFTGLTVLNQSTLEYNDTLSLWNIGNLTGGASKSLKLTINITNTGYYNNAFLVWSNENDANPQNNLALDNFQINDTKVDINIRITANKTYVTNNETILFTVTVTNPSLNTATDVNVTIDIPNEFIITSFIGNDTNTSYYIGNLTPSGVFNFTFTAKLNSTNASTITVNATLNETDYNYEDNLDSITILPLGNGADGVADLHVNITVNEQYPEIETVPIFTIWVTNFGPDNVTNVVIPVYVPENCTNTAFYANASGVIWNTSTNTITIPQVAVGEIVYTDIYYVINTTVPIIFNVSASSDQFDPNITDNKASISLYPWEETPTCDLNITIVPIGNDFHAGDIIKFNVTIRNYGEKTAQNVTISSIIPAGLTLINITSSSSFVQTSDGWFISNITKTISEASAKSFIVAYNITNKGLYHTTMEVNTSTVDVDPTSNGMGVAIYAGELDSRIKLPTNLTNPAFSGGTTLNASKGDLLKFKSRLTALNDTTNTMKNFADQVLYANITSSDGSFSITVESIDLTLGTNGYANFAVNTSLLLPGTVKYNITVFYKGNSTSDYVYLPTVSKTVQRQLNIKT